LPLIKGVKFNENNDTFESYIDMWHYDKNQLPQYGTMWASEPWEITAATERLVSNGKLSYSRSDANIRQNEQLSVVLPSHSELIRQELEKMKLEKFVPNSLKGLVTVDYALKRYDSSIQWINLHQNAAIGNGPYYLDTFNPSGGIVILKKFNDSTYPYEAGYFSSFEDPQNIKINKIAIPKFIKIGSPFKFDITVNLENDTKQFNGMINYFISDRNDNVIIKNSFDSKNRTNDPIVKEDNTDLQNTMNKGTDQIMLSIEPDKTKQLSPGPAKLKLFITSENSLRPIISENVLIARR
jgi:peptide/nickel transport system substrate-binding protein